ncbi:hypothetical protein MUN81_17290 [Hymenobacter sp. 5317J-9]|uniref:hypothetical protein n=1 Tax=Hymenobacter sp. 5317J-9 TaxID=2932250 RepID=UPI001FD66228|nr:hypothetical protein [Hymenobacter sp. 5317J-9]UOQ96983.1 hypothetical protein MUN81_17290 [Hymenobacter sp. 5317J-9]
MKRISHALLFALLALGWLAAGCSKGAVSPEDAQANLLVGHWVLTQTDGGLSGHVTPADPARQQGIIFGSDKQVSFLLNGAVTGKTTYSLFQANSYVNRRPQTFLSYGARTGSEKEFIERVSATELVIVEDYADGRGYYYQRRP